MKRQHRPLRTLTASLVVVGTLSAAPARAQQTVRPVNDDVQTLIATSDGHFKAGQKELEQGHVEAAKAEFNLAIEVLLDSNYGGRTEPRICDHFDRPVDRISTYEVRALATRDGVTEKKKETASIDELLPLSNTLRNPAAPTEPKKAPP